MFIYEKKLQYPVKIKNTNPKLASVIISQYGGPDGELGASLRYLSQRFSMPYPELKGLLTDIGTEELAEIPQGRAKLSVGPAVLGDDEGCQAGVGVLDLHRVLELLLIDEHQSLPPSSQGHGSFSQA